MNYTIHPVAELDFEAYVDAFNEAYSDYFVPMNLSPQVMDSLIYREAIDLDQSLAAINGQGQIIGMGMLGVRDTAGWIGGMGVIPEYRRVGIGRAIMLGLLENARRLHLHHVDLEVIVQNISAYALYESLSFEKRRILAILERGVSPVEAPSSRYEVVDETLGDNFHLDIILQLFDQFHDVPNPWQRHREAIAIMLPNSDVRFLSDGSKRIVGYAMGHFGKERVQIIDAAVSPDLEDRHIAAQTLFAGLLNAQPRATSGMINVGEDDMILQALQALGYQQSLRQYEMRLVINEVEDDG